MQNIPASGVSGRWNLEKPETRKQKERGDVHLTLTLSTEKDQCLTSQEHRHLLKILFAYELQRSSVSIMGVMSIMSIMGIRCVLRGIMLL